MKGSVHEDDFLIVLNVFGTRDSKEDYNMDERKINYIYGWFPLMDCNMGRLMQDTR